MTIYVPDMREQQIPLPLTTIAVAVTGSENPDVTNVYFRGDYNTEGPVVAGILRAFRPVFADCVLLAKRLDKGAGKHLRALPLTGNVKAVDTLAKTADKLLHSLAFTFRDIEAEYDEVLELVDVLYDGDDGDSAQALSSVEGADYEKALEQLRGLIGSLAQDLKGRPDSWQPGHVHAALIALSTTGEKLEPVFQHLDRSVEYGPALGQELSQLIAGNAEPSIGTIEYCLEKAKEKAGAAAKIAERAYGKLLAPTSPGQIPPGEAPTPVVMPGEESTLFMPGGSHLPPTVHLGK